MTITPQKFDAGILDQYFRAVKIAGNQKCKFVVDANNLGPIKEIAGWFGEMENEKIDLNKGIFLVGNVGTGKSMLMQIFGTLNQARIFPSNKFFRQITCREVLKKFAQDGPRIYDEFVKVHSKMVYGETKLSYDTWLFDELSEASEGVNYGQRANVMADLIEDRYAYWQRNGAPTHFTSNLMPEQISAIFGDRVRSRLREMCNIIVLTGEDRRK